ncbi:MAG TPA: cysteine hydrolase family protein [Sphingomicrobium sp.]|nr:cysteine hydrolase family protein [Sphingomicrobium sp.]
MRSYPCFEQQKGIRAVIIENNTTLIVIDTQMGFNDPKWGERNNSQAEANIALLLAAWRKNDLPVIHVHHDSVSPTGIFRPGTPGHAAKPEAAPLGDEPIYHKSVNSAFIGTSLEDDLRRSGAKKLVITGLTTNHCVSTTTRMAGNLGFDAYLVSDATATFARAHVDGRMRDAEEVHLAALSDLRDEFATIADTKEVLAAIERASSEPAQA